jgi:hypothetical protein
MISKDVIQRLVHRDFDSMGFKIMLKLSCAHDYSISYFFHLRVYFFEPARALETKYIGTSCDIFLSSFDTSLSFTRDPLTIVCIADTYRMSG